jgi:hypothetical protein
MWYGVVWRGKTPESAECGSDSSIQLGCVYKSSGDYATFSRGALALRVLYDLNVLKFLVYL